MNVRIIKCSVPDCWYIDRVGDVIEVHYESERFYHIVNCVSSRLLLKEDAKVVECVEKSCDNCSRNKDCCEDRMYCNKSGFVYWEPIEQPLQSCATCEDELLDKHTGKCAMCKLSKTFVYWRSADLKVKDVQTEKSCQTCGYKKPCYRCEDGRLVEWIANDPSKVNTGVDYAEDCDDVTTHVFMGSRQQGKSMRQAIHEHEDKYKNGCSTCHYAVDKPRDKCGLCSFGEYKGWKQQDEIVTNEHGAKQSKTEYLWTDFCPEALLRVAKLSNAGCKKYGLGNWKKISKIDHIGHAITHMFKYLAGCKEEDHLAHACWRVLAAMGVEE